MKFLNRNILLSALIGLATGCSHIDEQQAQNTLNEAKRAYQKASAQNYPSNELAQVADLIRQAEQTEDFEEREKFARLAQQQMQAFGIRQTIHQTSHEKTPPKQVIEEDNDDRPQSWEDILTQFKHRKISQGWVLSLENDKFEGNHLIPTVQSQLKRLASFLKQNPRQSLSIESSTHNLGDQAYTLGLAQRIAEEVRLILLQRGVSSARIAVKSSVRESSAKINHPKHHVDMVVSGGTFH